MTEQEKQRILCRHWFSTKKNLFKKVPQLLSNSKLAKRRAKAGPIETCISQSDNPEKCKDIH